MSKKPKEVWILNPDHYPQGDLPDPLESDLESIVKENAVTEDQFYGLRRVRERVYRKRLWSKGRVDEAARSQSAMSTGTIVNLKLEEYELLGWRQSREQAEKAKLNTPSAVFDEVLWRLIRSRPDERDPKVFWWLLCNQSFWSGDRNTEILPWHKAGKQWRKGPSRDDDIGPSDYLCWDTARPSSTKRTKISWPSFKTKVSRLRSRLTI